VIQRTFFIVILACLLGIWAGAQTTAFTYQGKLSDGGPAASGNYDLQFKLFDALSGGTQLGTTQTLSSIAVASGIFTVTLDFGDQFPGANRWLDISAKKTTDPSFTPLTPRQPITSGPHAIRSLNSGSADSLSAACVGCVTNGQIQSLDGGKLTGVITGNGSGITNINGGNITNGTVDVAQLAPNLVDGQQRNLTLIATHRWDILRPQATFGVGTNPEGVAFDGTNIWVTNFSSFNVTKLRASDGANLGTFAVINTADAVVYDGVNIWVGTDNGLQKIRPSDGAILGTFSVGKTFRGLVFDGANIWGTNVGTNTATKIRASDGTTLGTFTVGTFPLGIEFDGANIWVGNKNSNSVTELRASDGLLLGTFTVGTNPVGLAFDGSNIWVTNENGGNVTKLRASDGANLGTFSAGGLNPIGVAFDGTNIWIANAGPASKTVTKLRTSDGSILGTFQTGGTNSAALVFDGTNMWVTSNDTNNVTRLFPVVP
jgi:hypothetical protein